MLDEAREDTHRHDVRHARGFKHALWTGGARRHGRASARVPFPVVRLGLLLGLGVAVGVLDRPLDPLAALPDEKLLLDRLRDRVEEDVEHQRALPTSSSRRTESRYRAATILMRIP